MTAIPRSLHLLPANATPLEQALSASDARLLDVPVPIRDLWRWDVCPESHLPWLAWAMSVDIWDEDWPVQKKRSVVHRSFALHRLKGTLGGIRAHLALVDAELIRAVRPPAKSFLGASPTAAEKERFLASLPQIRIHLSKRHGSAGKRAFFGTPGADRQPRGAFFADQFERPILFPADVDTRAQIAQRAVYVHDGVTRELTWSRLDERGERVFLRGTDRRGVYCGRAAGRHFTRSTAADRIVTLDLARDGAVDQLMHRFAVVPKMDPVNAVPFRVYEHGRAPRSVFSGSPISGRYFVPSGAVTRTYDAVHFKPRELALTSGQATSYMGVERFGMPAFTAELKVAVRGRRPRRAADRFVGGHFYAAPRDALDNALAAVRASKSCRDEILLDTKTWRPLTVGTPLFIGAALPLGSYTRS